MQTLKCIGDGYDDCAQPVVWLHCGQFGGDLPFCDAHARAQHEFGVDTSHWVWRKAADMVPTPSQAAPVPPTALAPAVAKLSHRKPTVPTEATIVGGDIVKDSIDSSKNIEYKVSLIRNGPGNVEFLLTIDGKICGKLPFDNLVKAQVRLDPDHASGPERQIQKLRQETAEARALMYDWQAQAMQLAERLRQYEPDDDA